VAILLAMTGVGFLVNADPWLGLGKLAGIVWGVGMLIATLRLAQTRPGLILGMVLFSLVGSSITLVSLFGTRWPETKVFALDAITAHLPQLVRGLEGAADGFHPNQVAGSLLWVIPLQFGLAVALWADLRGWMGKSLAIFVGFVGLLSVLVMLLTQSRAGYLALALGFGIAALWVLATKLRRIFWIMVFLIVVGTGLAITTVSESNLDALFASTPIEEGAVSVDTLESRVEIWSRAIFAIQDFPLTGVGLNAFRDIVHIFYPLFLLPPGVDFGHA